MEYVDTKYFHYTVRTLIHFTVIPAHSMILHSFLETSNSKTPHTSVLEV